MMDRKALKMGILDALDTPELLGHSSGKRGAAMRAVMPLIDQAVAEAEARMRSRFLSALKCLALEADGWDREPDETLSDVLVTIGIVRDMADEIAAALAPDIAAAEAES